MAKSTKPASSKTKAKYGKPHRNAGKRFAALSKAAMTYGERSFVRGFIYHAVQKAAHGGDLTEEQRAELLKKRAALAVLVTDMPAFKDDIAKIDAELGGTVAAGVRWQDLVPALAAEPAVIAIATPAFALSA